MKNSRVLILGMIGFITATSCDPKEPAEPCIPNEEEVITTLNFSLVPNDGGDTIVLTFQDLDGDGGDAPVITGGTLNANTMYSGSMELLNESGTTTEDITEEIDEEAEEHQFFFETSISGLEINYDDLDANGFPIGLATELNTNEAGAGTLTVTLRHEPAKDASGVSDGDIANAGGETDIEVIFDVNVQ